MSPRNLKIVEFINMVQFCTSKQIKYLFFSDNKDERYCNLQLTKLTEYGYIKRKYYNIEGNINSYVYYINKKPHKRMIRHDLILIDVITHFMKSYSIKEVIKIPKIDDVTPDAMIIIRTGHSLQPILIEVQLSPSDCFKKYYNFAQKFKKYSGLDEKLILYVITDLDLNVIKLRDLHVVVDDLNMSKIGGISRCF